MSVGETPRPACSTVLPSSRQVAQLILDQTEKMLVVARRCDLWDLIPTLETVRDEALAVLAGRRDTLHS